MAVAYGRSAAVVMNMSAYLGRNITVLIEPMSPYLMTRNGKPSGFIGDVWILLAEYLGLECQYSTGSDVNYGEAHVLLQGPTFSEPGIPSLSFAYSWYNVYLTETSLLTSTLSYLNNWSTNHWTVAVATVFLFVGLLYSMLRIAERWYPNQAIDLPPIPLKAGKRLLNDLSWRRALRNQLYLRTRNEESLSNCLMAGVASVCGQGGVIYSHVQSIRILILSFLLFGMIVSSAYSALLVSQFTTAMHINSQSLSRLCVRQNSVQLRSQGMIYLPSCTHLICSREYAVLETPELVRDSLPQCTLVNFRERLLPFKLSLKILPAAEADLQKSLRSRLWRLRETGLVARMRAKWLRPPETTSRRRTTYSVTIDQVSGAFACYFSVMLACVSLLLGEKLWRCSQALRVHRRWYA